MENNSPSTDIIDINIDGFNVNQDNLRSYFNACSPLCNFQLTSNQDFKTSSISTLKATVFPKIVSKIQSYDTNTFQILPMFVKLISKFFTKEGIDLIDNFILTTFETELENNNMSKQSTYLDTYIKCSEMIDFPYRDDILIPKIQRYSAYSESNFRILAARLIPLVSNTERVSSTYLALSLDRVPLVRVNVIQVLSSPGIQLNDKEQSPDFKTKIGQSVIDSILTSSVHDQAYSVQRAAATMIGVVAPHLIEPIKSFLSQQDTTKAALKSVKSIVEHNSFSCIYDAFQNAMIYQPENSCAVILNISRVIKKEEQQLLLDTAMSMRSHMTLINYLFKFSLAFDNKDIFLEFLNPTPIKKWRARVALMKQAILFIPMFKRRLVPIAQKFSNDDIAIVRNFSVDFWVELLKQGDEFATFDDLYQISNNGFHQKLVICKVIGKLGYDDKYRNAVEAMSKDRIANIRICMARNLIKSDVFDQFFKDATDPEINDLREHLEDVRINQ